MVLNYFRIYFDYIILCLKLLFSIRMLFTFLDLDNKVVLTDFFLTYDKTNGTSIQQLYTIKRDFI